MRQSPVTAVHPFTADDVTDWLGRPLCATCGLLREARRHEMPDVPAEVAEIEERRWPE